MTIRIKGKIIKNSKSIQNPVSIESEDACATSDLPFPQEMSAISIQESGNGTNEFKVNENIKKKISPRRKLIEEIRDMAAEKDYEFLDEEFHGSNYKHNWRCKYGHVWPARASNIKTGYGCPYCAKVNRNNYIRNSAIPLINYHNLLRPKGVEICIFDYKDTETFNSNTKILCSCSRGHSWVSTGGIMSRSPWCRKCKRIEKAMRFAEKNLLEAQTLASKHGAKCLTTLDEYMKSGKSSPVLRWKCSNGHELSRNLCRQKDKIYFCEICENGENTSIEDLRTLATARGGECLSIEYINGKTPYKWKCQHKHIWSASWFHVSSGNTWCPYCNHSTAEKICRLVFEKAYDADFPTLKPKWMLYKNKKTLELDGYNEELKIAFEHNGSQHYIVDGYFTRTEESLKSIKDRDEFKLMTCARDDIKVKLVIIRELDICGESRAIISKIIDECAEQGLILPNQDKILKIDINEAFTDTPYKRFLEHIKKTRVELVSEFKKMDERVTFRHIDCGYQWTAKPKCVLQGNNGCRRCNIRNGKNKKWTVELLDRMVKELHNGRCIRVDNKPGRDGLKFVFECQCGNVFQMTPSKAKSGRWCPTCNINRKISERLALKEERVKAKAAGQPIPGIKSRKIDPEKAAIHESKMLAGLQEVCIKRGGQCLIEKWRGNATKGAFRCEYGHKWDAAPYSIKSGNWCPYCSGHKIIDPLKPLQDHANRRGGKLLTTVYPGAYGVVNFSCSEGHTWSTTPHQIKMKWSWCPYCSGHKLKDPLGDMKRIAEERESELISTEYLNAKSPLKFRCKCGNEFELSQDRVKQGAWCSCRRRKTRLFN